MRVAARHRAATVWFEDGVPARLFWTDRRWRVLDHPTRLDVRDDALSAPVPGGSPQRGTGWRFIAGAEDQAETHVFDLRKTAPDRFEVLRLFE